MPSWKKVIVSGSDASLNSLQVTTYVLADQFSGSFSGSFQGNGSGLTNIISSSYSLSSSHANYSSDSDLLDGRDSSVFATTGSNTFVGNQIISGNLDVKGQFTASNFRYPTVDGIFGVEVLRTNGAGRLALEVPDTLYEAVKNDDIVTIPKGTPVKVVSSVGNQALIVRADAGNPALMPASYILAQNLAPQAEGLGIILGKITGVNTDGFTPGKEVYVAVGGGYTQVRPTGSSQVQPLGFPVKVASNGGSGVIMNPGVANDLPNLTQGYLWVGGTGSLPTTILSSSFAKVGENNTFTGTQTFTNIVVNGTGSFSYIQSVTGSAKIIGDAYIILNNNLPAEPFAGIKVIESGSTDITASLLWDGANNHWIYENTSGSTYGAAGLLSGPRSTGVDNILYPTQYRVLRSQGGDHVYDSNITDDNTNVSISIPLSVTSDITSSAIIKALGGFEGNVTGNASTATTASYVEYSNVANKPSLISSSIQVNYLGLSNIPANIVSSSLQIATDISGAFTSTSSSIAIDITSLDGRLDTLESKTLVSSSSQIIYSSISNIPAGIISSSNQLNNTTLTGMTVSGSFSGSFQGDGSGLTNLVVSIDTGSFATTGSNNFYGNQNISGSLTITGSVYASHLVQGSVFLSPRVVTQDVIIPEGYNGIVFGPTDITGSIQIGSGSTLSVFDPSGYVQDTEFNLLSGSLDTLLSKTLVSSSAQVVSLLPSGIISGSSQLDGSVLTNVTVTGSFSGSYTGDGSQLTGIQSGLDELQVVLLSQFFG